MALSGMIRASRIYAFNSANFEINGDAITQVLFKGERLAIDGKDLVMKYWDKQAPIRYEKQ
jgi:hypothetical protein